MRRRPDRLCLVFLFAFLLFLFSDGTSHALAQDEGPQCPSGFVWKRMSGVGCVQEGCMDIANAKLSYTSSCICEDGYRGCYEPVDYTGFNRDVCGPNCPTSRLVICVQGDAQCPGEVESTATPKPEPTAKPTALPDIINETTEPGEDENDWDDATPAPKPSPGPDYDGASSAGAAAGAVTVSALLAAWLINHVLSGGNLKDGLQTIIAWDKDTPPQAGAEVKVPVSRVSGSVGVGEHSPSTPRTPTGINPLTTLNPSTPSLSLQGVEQGLNRRNIQVDEGLKAIELSRKQLSEKVSRMPQWMKDSEWWQKNVKPQLERVNGWTDVSTLQDLVNRIDKHLKVRDAWNRDAKHVPKGNSAREGGVWVERGLMAGGRVISEANKRLITGPARNVVSKLPDSVVKSAKKILDQHDRDVEALVDGLRKVPRVAVKHIYEQGGGQRAPVFKEFDLNIKTRPQDRFDVTRSPRQVNKRIQRHWQPVRKWIVNQKYIPRFIQRLFMTEKERYGGRP